MGFQEKILGEYLCGFPLKRLDFACEKWMKNGLWKPFYVDCELVGFIARQQIEFPKKFLPLMKSFWGAGSKRFCATSQKKIISLVDLSCCLSFAHYILTSPSASDFFIIVLQSILRNQQGFALKHVPNTNTRDNRQSPNVFVLLRVVCPLARAESFLYTFSPRLSWSALFFLSPPHSRSTSHLFFTLFPCVYHPEVLNWITVWQHCKQNSCRHRLWRLSEP